MAQEQPVLEERRSGAWASVKRWRARHPAGYEFIMFNLLANIATITNFAVLFLCNAVLFAGLADTDFNWGPFDYSAANGGLAGFLAFLFAYGVAQTVNFIVQRKLVFHADNRLAGAITTYIFAVIVVYFICLYVPTLVMEPLSTLIGGWAPYAANCVNIMIQVAILFPTMKFVVMRRVQDQTKANSGSEGVQQDSDAVGAGGGSM
ncbi:MAG: GtrA family protein [Bifidobacteriaceae bacterium]|jgi:putative flippase GtrA|nr:GtrA family protein [Bifidobacteriaceae bacterium]